jgi:hypothetical protein
MRKYQSSPNREPATADQIDNILECINKEDGWELGGSAQSLIERMQLSVDHLVLALEDHISFHNRKVFQKKERDGRYLSNRVHANVDLDPSNQVYVEVCILKDLMEIFAHEHTVERSKRLPQI